MNEIYRVNKGWYREEKKKSHKMEPLCAKLRNP